MQGMFCWTRQLQHHRAAVELRKGNRQFELMDVILCAWHSESTICIFFICAMRTSKCFGWNEMERKQKERRPKEKKGIVILFELFVFFLSISFRVHFSLFQPSVKPNLQME